MSMMITQGMGAQYSPAGTADITLSVQPPDPADIDFIPILKPPPIRELNHG